MPFRIYTDCKFSESALQLFQKGLEGQTLIFPQKKSFSVLDISESDPRFDEAEIVLGQPEVEAVLHSKKIRWLQIPTAGYTRYDTDFFRQAAQEKGLIVTNSSHVYDEACAQHLLSFMLAQSRCLPGALATRASSKSDTWHSLRSQCRILHGQNAVVIGYGSIAEKLIKLLQPFGMNLTAYRRKARGDEAVPILSEEELPKALATADHVLNILPANEGTVKFFERVRFGQMKTGAVFYNIGRGTTVDQDALAASLQSGKLAAAWLDVTNPEPLPDNHPLWALENCYITPHTAGGHQNESTTVAQHFLDNFQRYLASETLHNRIF